MAGKGSRYFMVRRKPDANQSAIVAALRAVGIDVKDTSGVGDGFADIVALRPDKTVVLMEIKMPKGKLRESQEQTHQDWPIVTVRTIEEALNAVGVRA